MCKIIDNDKIVYKYILIGKLDKPPHIIILHNISIFPIFIITQIGYYLIFSTISSKIIAIPKNNHSQNARMNNAVNRNSSNAINDISTSLKNEI